MYLRNLAYPPRSILRILLSVTICVLLASCGSGSEENGPGGTSNGPNSIVLSWKAPTTNVDQSCIGGDLAGFVVHYGFNSGVYSDSATLSIDQASCITTSEITSCGSVQVCSYTINDLPSATWFVAVAAYDMAGNDGPLSNEATYTVY